MALYRAKEEGRGIYRFFAAEMNQRLLERRALEADILEAMRKGQFELHYQPQFDLADRQVVGAEALLAGGTRCGATSPDQTLHPAGRGDRPHCAASANGSA